MTPLVQAIANLPESQLVRMVNSLCAQKIATIITDDMSVKKKIEEVDKIRNSEIVVALPEEEKAKMLEMFAQTELAIKEIGKFKRR